MEANGAKREAKPAQPAGLPRTWRTLQYGMLGLLGVLAVLSYVLFALVAGSSPAEVVNRAGLQRMLSQRIALAAVKLEQGRGEAADAQRTILAEALDELEAGHKGLLARGQGPDLGGMDPGDVAGRFAALEPHYAGLVHHGREVLRLSKEGGPAVALLREHSAAVQEAAERFLPLMDAIVRQYDIEARESARLLGLHQALLLGITLAVLAAVGLFAIRPSIRRVEAAFEHVKHGERELRRSNRELVQANRDLAALLEERGAFEKALRESEERFRTLAETASDAIITVDASTRMYYANHAAEVVFGYTKPELIEQPIGMLMREDVRKKYNGMLTRYFETGEKTVSWRAFEVPGWHKSGRTIPLEISLGEYFRDGARFLTGVIRDISERRKAEEALRRSENRLQIALAGGDLGLWDWHVPTGEVHFNERYATLLGYDPREMAPSVDTWRQMLHPEDEPAVSLALADHFEGRRPMYEAEQRLRTKDGSWRWVLARGQVVEWDEDHKATRVAGTIHDMTDHHEAAEAIERARRQENELRARIQETLLHAHVPPAIGALGLAVRTLSSQHMDGDFYDVITYADGVFDVVVGDVMGKGTTAALVGAATKHHIVQTAVTLLSQAGAAATPASASSPRKIVQRVHEELTPGLISIERFVTLVYVRFEDGGRRMRFVNCGHTRSLLYRKQSGSVEFVEGTNTALGVIESERYEEYAAEIAPGDLLLLYSDGITEAQSPEGAFFGETRLQGLVQRYADEGPRELTGQVERAILAFTGSNHVADDVTCIAVQACEGESSGEMRLETPSRLEELAVVRAFAREAAQRAYLGEDAANLVELAVHEAASNVIRHAYHGDPAGSLDFLAYIEEDALVIELRHHGAPFEGTAAEVPPDSHRENGFGLQIIRGALDDVRYSAEPGGVSLVRLIKRRPRQSRIGGA